MSKETELNVMSASQYVVWLLQEKEKELAEQQEKYDELLKEYLKVNLENTQNKEKLEKIRKFFKVEFNVGENTGYHIQVLDLKGNYETTLAYSWESNPNKQEQEFLDLLDLFGLELPKKEEGNK